MKAAVDCFFRSNCRPTSFYLYHVFSNSLSVTDFCLETEIERSEKPMNVQTKTAFSKNEQKNLLDNRSFCENLHFQFNLKKIIVQHFHSVFSSISIKKNDLSRWPTPASPFDFHSYSKLVSVTMFWLSPMELEWPCQSETHFSLAGRFPKNYPFGDYGFPRKKEHSFFRSLV